MRKQTRKHLMIIGVAVVALSLIAAGCGDDDDDDGLRGETWGRASDYKRENVINRPLLCWNVIINPHTSLRLTGGEPT